MCVHVGAAVDLSTPQRVLAESMRAYMCMYPHKRSMQSHSRQDPWYAALRPAA